jgi:hypothetical protein
VSRSRLVRRPLDSAMFRSSPVWATLARRLRTADTSSLSTLGREAKTHGNEDTVPGAALWRRSVDTGKKRFAKARNGYSIPADPPRRSI